MLPLKNLAHKGLIYAMSSATSQSEKGFGIAA